MSLVSSIMDYNQQFVEEKQYEPFITDKFPDKKMVILTCMDTRLFELLPKAMNLKNGDAKIIKNAGAILTQPFGSAMRSILVAIYGMNAQEVLVIGHHGCGMTNLNHKEYVEKFKEQGITEEVIATLENSGIRMERFLRGFASPQEGIMSSVKLIRNHPLVPEHVKVHALIIDPTTGKLELLAEDYREAE